MEDKSQNNSTVKTILFTFFKNVFDGKNKSSTGLIVWGQPNDNGKEAQDEWNETDRCRDVVNRISDVAPSRERILFFILILG
ncbi:hypothetical protein YC2023_098618 [Brassica napus]